MGHKPPEQLASVRYLILRELWPLCAQQSFTVAAFL